MIPCKLGPLARCEPRELVKVKVEETTEWGIVGLRSRAYAPLVFLTGKNAPFVIDMFSAGGDFETYPALKFGTEYRIFPDVTGLCQIGDELLFKRAGSLVLANTDWYLVVNQYRQSGPRWFHLQTGEVRGEPDPHRVAFERWTLWLHGLKAEASDTAVVTFPGA
jgi:hypothetical protein